MSINSSTRPVTTRVPRRRPYYKCPPTVYEKFKPPPRPPVTAGRETVNWDTGDFGVFLFEKRAFTRFEITEIFEGTSD